MAACVTLQLTPCQARALRLYGLASKRIKKMDESVSIEPDLNSVERLRHLLGTLDPRQVAIWRETSPARKLRLRFQAHQFFLGVVRTTERHRHPDLSPAELNWRVLRRMHGDLHLGRGNEVQEDA